MTVIAVVKNKQGKLMMGADRRLTIGYHYAQDMETPKISKKNGMLFGATGNGALCSLFVEEDAFDVPDKDIKSINRYMYYIFKDKVIDFLINQGYGFKNKHTGERIIKLPPDTGCEVVICIENQVWCMSLENHLEDEYSECSVSLERISAPYSTGCGGHGTPDSVFKYILQTKGYITKQDLHTTLEIVAEISPGCNDKIDILVSD